MTAAVELRTVYAQISSTARRVRPAQLLLTGGLLAGILAAENIQRTELGRTVLRGCCVVLNGGSAQALALRLPGSVIAPAPNLPIWGALLQVAVVVGVAELLLGWRKALLVGAVSHCVATVIGQALSAFPTPLHFDGPAHWGHPDTGPSAFVLGLGLYVLCQYRALRLAWWLIVFVLAGLACQVELASVEHAAALLAAGIFYLLERRRPRELRSLRAISLPRLTRSYSAASAVGIFVLISAWHTAQPLTIRPTESATTGNNSRVSVVQLTTKTAVPVWVEAPTRRDIYFSARRDCTSHVLKQSTLMWRRPLWICAQPQRRPLLVRVEYSLYGVDHGINVVVPADRISAR